MKKAITLPQFVKDFPKDKCFIKKTYFRPMYVDFDYNKDLSYEQKMEYVGWTYKQSVRLSSTNDCVYFIRSHKTLARRGKTFYPVDSDRESIYINKNSVSFHRASSEFIFSFLRTLGIDWFKDIDIEILRNVFKDKTIFRRVITNRIYNEETLYKSIAKSVHGLSDISWKTVKKYYKFTYSNTYTGRRWFSLTDLYYFTKNIDQTIDKLITVDAINETLYSDLLSCAIKLNQVVDFTWSLKRIQEEHKKQIKRLLAKEIDNKENNSIYDTTAMTFPFRLLNTEKDIFVEGNVMHHCLYNCYYRKIKNHDYIAFHLDSPEECTLGIHLVGGHPELNQIYKKYDQPVSDETRQYVITFINTHASDLLKLFAQKVDEKPVCNTTPSRFITPLTEIPF